MAVMNRVVNDTPRPILDINPEIPPWMCEIVEKLLEKKPDDRFQTAEETLHGRIIPAVAFSTHTTLYAMGFEQLPEGLAGILAAPIRMMDQASFRSAPPDRHLQCITD